MKPQLIYDEDNADGRHYTATPTGILAGIHCQQSEGDDHE